MTWAIRSRFAGWLRLNAGLGRQPRGIISFPKSGRTWLMVMLDHLGIAVRFHHAGAETAAPLIEGISRREADHFGKSLILVRDPRDTVVSYFHACTRRQGIHAQMRSLYPTDLSHFIRDPRFGIEKIARYNLFWAQVAARSQSSHIAIATYEQLHADTTLMLFSISRFFHSQPSRENLISAVESGQFDTMRQREASGEYEKHYGRRLTPGDPGDPDSFKVRKGHIGGYREELSVEDIRYCDDLLGRLGYFDTLDDCLEAAAVADHANLWGIPAEVTQVSTQFRTGFGLFRRRRTP